jgi:hypothetical protein
MYPYLSVAFDPIGRPTELDLPKPQPLRPMHDGGYGLQERLADALIRETSRRTG